MSRSPRSCQFFSVNLLPNTGPTRTRSRFEWINQVGIEHVLYNF